MSFNTYRPFAKRNVFPKYVIVFMFGISFALFFSSALTIVTGVGNAVQYIKQIVLTSDGTVGGTTGIVLDGVNQRLGVGVSNPNNSIQVKDLINFDNSTRSTFIGNQAGKNNTGGNNNTAVGYRSLQNNTIGEQNTAIGNYALMNNIDGIENTAIGVDSLLDNIIGYRNTAIGNYALMYNIDGYDNTAVGYNSLGFNTGGVGNTAIGSSSLGQNIIGNYNIALGIYSLRNNKTGSNNISIGYNSLLFNNVGNYNIAIGQEAGRKSIGNSNIYLGFQAGYNETGSNKLYIANSGTQTLIYGEFNNNRVGINTTSPQAALEVNNTLRITPSNPGSDFCTMTGSIIFTTIGDGTNQLCFCDGKFWMLVSAPTGGCFL